MWSYCWYVWGGGHLARDLQSRLPIKWVGKPGKWGTGAGNRCRVNLHEQQLQGLRWWIANRLCLVWHETYFCLLNGIALIQKRRLSLPTPPQRSIPPFFHCGRIRFQSICDRVSPIKRSLSRSHGPGKTALKRQLARIPHHLYLSFVMEICLSNIKNYWVRIGWDVSNHVCVQLMWFLPLVSAAFKLFLWFS